MHRKCQAGRLAGREQNRWEMKNPTQGGGHKPTFNEHQRPVFVELK